MYSFELIKHNKIWIYQNQGPEYSTNRNQETLTVSRTGAPLSAMAYFIEKPQITISQIWNDDARRLQQFLARGKNFVASLMPVFESLARGIKEGIFTGSVKDIGTKVSQQVLDAVSQVSERVTAANAQEWGGAAPLSISMELIFMNEKAPVYRSDVYPLLNMSGFSGLDGLGNMVGPSGYHGMAAGIINMDKILRGEYEGLVSAVMIQNGKTALELYRVLVVESVQITGSEQLYATTRDEPAYKWIKANITFKTACPLPIPAASRVGYSSIGDLLGSSAVEER